MASVLPTPRKLSKNVGLCSYSDPEKWFDKADNVATEEAKRICGNCPIRQGCARQALESKVTDGVWAGVRLPGKALSPEAMEVARRQLKLVVAAMDHQPEEHRLHTTQMREIVHRYRAPVRHVERRSA